MLTFLGMIKIRKGGEWGEEEGWGEWEFGQISSQLQYSHPEPKRLTRPKSSPESIYGPVKADRFRIELIWK